MSPRDIKILGFNFSPFGSPKNGKSDLVLTPKDPAFERVGSIVNSSVRPILKWPRFWRKLNSYATRIQSLMFEIYIRALIRTDTVFLLVILKGPVVPVVH